MKKNIVLFTICFGLFSFLAWGNTFGFQTNQTREETTMNQKCFYVTAGGQTFQAEFAGNSSAEAFKALLAKGNLTITMSDYGNFEKVGNLGTTLPRNDTRITTSPGDIILYQRSSITIYYDTNTWSFTRLGKINGVTREELLSALGKDSVQVTFSLERP